MEDVSEKTRDFVYKACDPHTFSTALVTLLMTCNFETTSLSDSKATLQQEIIALNFLAPELESSTDDEIAAVNRTTVIEDLVDQSASRRTRVETKMNVLGAQKSKEDIMSCLANWLSEFDYRFTIMKDGPTHPLSM
eukprot:7603611-Ditylum_brightwellii.AAC.1